MRISEDDVGIHAELAPIFAFVMHELTTNAMKYGALSTTGGTVEITLDHRGDCLRIDWVEKDGPKGGMPLKKGFGTTLIETAVPFELNGTSEITYASDGLEARLKLSQETLVDKVDVEQASQTVVSEGLNISSLDPSAKFGKKCLLVEDNYIVSLDTSTVLNDMDFDEVAIARNLIDGLTCLTRFRPGLVTLDINLAHGQKSDSIADALVDEKIPFIFVTGYGETQKLNPKYEGLPVLKKPVQRNELLIALAQLDT